MNAPLNSGQHDHGPSNRWWILTLVALAYFVLIQHRSLVFYVQVPLSKELSLSKLQAGRLVQRVLEINTYRLLALLSLPLAREASPRIHRMDLALGQITERLADAPSGTEKQLLDQLSRLASEAEKVGARTNYRFSATRAYFDIVQARLDEIRQQRIQGLQTFSEFLERRLVPAVNSSFSTRERLDGLSERMSRLGGLLRARVEVQIEEQNRDLLASMNRRAQLQLRLQQTVEGLSVAAISYYVVGLVGYVAKGAKPALPGLSSEVITAAAVPVAVLCIWLLVRRIRRHHAREDTITGTEAD